MTKIKTENFQTPLLTHKPKSSWKETGLFIGIMAQVFLICAIVSFFSSFKFMEGLFVSILFVSLPLAVIATFLIGIGLVLCIVGIFTQDGSRKTAHIGLGVLSLTFIFLSISSSVKGALVMATSQPLTNDISKLPTCLSLPFIFHHPHAFVVRALKLLPTALDFISSAFAI